MPVRNTYVFVEPEEHYLEYSSVILRDIVRANSSPLYTIGELQGGRANPDDINRALERLDPILFFGIGHGNDDIYTVECTTPYMRSGDPNAQRMKGRVVGLNSCKTGADLGFNLVNEIGALTFFGSRESFVFYVGESPGVGAARAPFVAELQYIASLLQGTTTGQAQVDRMAAHDQWIEYFTTGDGRAHEHAYLLVRLLRINKDIAVMYGMDDIRIGEAIVPPVPDLWTSLTMALGLAPLLIVGAVIGTAEVGRLVPP